MLLSDRDIEGHIKAHNITISPLDFRQIQPASVDVRLDRFFRTFTTHNVACIDPAQPNNGLTDLIEVEEDQSFVMHPGEFALGSTVETVTLSRIIAARLEGKSSLGRLGLLTHSTAGFIDPGFSGPITLELANVSNLPILLWPGMKIGQLCFMEMKSPAQHEYGSSYYGSRYQNQQGPTESRSYVGFVRGIET